MFVYVILLYYICFMNDDLTYIVKYPMDVIMFLTHLKHCIYYFDTKKALPVNYVIRDTDFDLHLEVKHLEILN